jgi:hypothetical protein
MATSTKDPTSTYVIAAGWNNPTRAYTSNNSRASSSNAAAVQGYGDYGFTFTDETIDKVEYGVEGYINSSRNRLYSYISWDGGSTWGSINVQNDTSETTRWHDETSQTTWTAAKLNDSNLKTKIWWWASGGCLVKGTPILTPEGLKNIEDLKVGDMVMGQENGKDVLTQIIAKTTHLQDTVVLNYKGVGFAGDHEVMIDGEWKSVMDLNLKGRSYKGNIYNIETGTENFYSKDKLLIHNLTKT